MVESITQHLVSFSAGFACGEACTSGGKTSGGKVTGAMTTRSHIALLPLTFSDS